QHRGGTVGHDLAHHLADLVGVEAHHDDGVGAHGLGVLHHAVHGVAARFLQQGGVFDDLAAHDGTQAGHDIAAEAAAPHHHPEHLALHFLDAIADDVLSGGHDHGQAPEEGRCL